VHDKDQHTPRDRGGEHDSDGCKDPNRSRNRGQVVPAQGKGGLEQQRRQEERKHDAGRQGRQCVESERIGRHNDPHNNEADCVRDSNALDDHRDQTGRNQQEKNDG